MAKKSGIVRKVKRPARIGFCSYLGDVQGCGTIRVIYPYFLLNHDREKDLQFHTQYLSKYVSVVDYYKEFTILQFQRAATEGHVKIYQHFKSQIQTKYKIPIIYEIDDLLVNIPEWNYAHVYYKKLEDNIKWLMENSDGMITSTPTLKEVYSKYNKNINVIPNHLPKFIWQDIFPAHEYYNEKNKVKILWAGSQNHFHIPEIQGDHGKKGGDFGKGLMDFIRKTIDVYEWHLMGAIPTELRDIKNKINFHKWENIFNYPRKMKSIEADICIAPLQDNIFNACKSNIKSLEYTATGAPGVYSDVAPYKAMALRARTDEEFVSHIEDLAKDIDYRAKIFKRDRQKVNQQLFWEENNNLRKYVNSYLGLFGQKL